MNVPDRSNLRLSEEPSDEPSTHLDMVPEENERISKQCCPRLLLNAVGIEISDRFLSVANSDNLHWSCVTHTPPYS